MKIRFVILIFLLLILWHPVNAATCTITIGALTTIVDGNNTKISPGDTICIKSGTRNYLMLKNFSGSIDKPITIVNSGGQVVISSNISRGIVVNNVRFFRITGTGDFNIPYGFKIIKSVGEGIGLERKTTDFEIDHVEIGNIPGIGIVADTWATCKDGSSNDYDYDHDGKIKYDLDDVVTRSNFSIKNVTIHDVYVHNTGRSGIYVGNSFYGQEETITCASGTEKRLDPVSSNIHIYGNVVSDLGMKGIQVGSALENCDIHNNLVSRYGQAMVLSFRDGILNNPGSVCNIYNNFIANGTGTGIYDQGGGGNTIYNNIIVSPGNDNAGIDGIDVGLGFGNTGRSIGVLNNTIISPSGFGVFFVSDKGSNNRVQDNIIVNPGNFSVSGSRAYVMIPSSNKTVLVSNNLTTQDILSVKFGDNYALLSNSPAIDRGTNSGISEDYLGITRPQGAAFDIGAYEFAQVVTPTPTGMATPTATSTPTPTGTPCSCPCACR